VRFRISRPVDLLHHLQEAVDVSREPQLLHRALDELSQPDADELATPVLRVVVSLGGFIARRERTMSIVAALILVVIALSIVLGRAES